MKLKGITAEYLNELVCRQNLTPPLNDLTEGRNKFLKAVLNRQQPADDVASGQLSFEDTTATQSES